MGAPATRGGDDEQARHGVDHDSEEEQNQAEADQRLQVQVSGGLRELVGDYGGYGANNEAWMLGSFPMTMVTAMVSPKARARPRKIEPKIPNRA